MCMKETINRFVRTWSFYTQDNKSLPYVQISYMAVLYYSQNVHSKFMVEQKLGKIDR